VLILTQDRCAVCDKRTVGSEIVLNAPDGSLDEWVKWNLVSIRLEIVLVSEQYRCIVCVERTIASELFWTHPTIFLGDDAQVEACLSPFGDSANLHAR
jgi:hypothetical protein